MKNKFLLFSGVIILSAILYNRLFRIRLPRNINTFIDSPYYILYIIILIGFIIMLCSTVLQLYMFLLNIDKKSSIFISKIKLIVDHKYNPITIISKSLILLDAFIKNLSPNYNDIYSYIDIVIIKIARFLLETNTKIIYTLFILRITPQLIVCFCFIRDILFHQEFNSFYKSLIVLILPLLLQYIQYSIKMLVDTNLEDLDDSLDIRILPSHQYTKETSFEDYQRISIYDWRDICLSPEKEDYICYNNLSQKTLDEINNDTLIGKHILGKGVSFMSTLFELYNYSYKFDEYKFIIETPINITKYTIYIIGWSYIILI